MNEVLHANVFFVIASIATVVFCVLTSLVLYQVFKISRSVRRIVERVEAGSEVIARDVATFREFVASGGILSRVIQFFINRSGKRQSRRRSRTDD